MRDGALLSWRWLNTCLLMGSSEWIPCFALLAHAAFAFLTKLSLSQPTSFLTFTLLNLSPIPTGEEWVSSCVVLICWLGLNYNSLELTAEFLDSSGFLPHTNQKNSCFLKNNIFIRYNPNQCQLGYFWHLILCTFYGPADSHEAGSSLWWSISTCPRITLRKGPK